MRGLTLIRFFGISCLAAILLSVLSFLTLRELNEISTRTHRQDFAVAMATEVENLPYADAMRAYNHMHQGPRGVRGQLWVVAADDHNPPQVLAANSDEPLPAAWLSMGRPEAVHDYTSKLGLFSFAPELTLIRLQGDTPTFLLTRVGRRPNNFPQLAPLILTFILVAGAVFLALSLTFYYLKGKSHEAKEVLSRLEKGDLKARFRIERFDEVGNLMLDFNRMASEIERLVHHVQETERARRSLLQELSHDLRTPLTSLRTSVETLQTHFEELSREDRTEFFSMVEGELRYFIRLVEDLFFIADLDEPRYKASTSDIDLGELLATEIRARQSQRMDGKSWSFEFAGLGSANILGDPHLVLRLFKNAFDNAGRFANSAVAVSLSESGKNWLAEIADDGPGIGKDELEAFGKRRVHRSRLLRDRVDGGRTHLSLGLGSVIMKSIADLHHGELAIENRTDANGTRIRVLLPKA